MKCKGNTHFLQLKILKNFRQMHHLELQREPEEELKTETVTKLPNEEARAGSRCVGDSEDKAAQRGLPDGQQQGVWDPCSSTCHQAGRCFLLCGPASVAFRAGTWRQGRARGGAHQWT